MDPQTFIAESWDDSGFDISTRIRKLMFYLFFSARGIVEILLYPHNLLSISPFTGTSTW